MHAGCCMLGVTRCRRRRRVCGAVHRVESRVQLRAYPLVVLQILRSTWPWLSERAVRNRNRSLPAGARNTAMCTYCLKVTCLTGHLIRPDPDLNLTLIPTLDSA